MKYKIIEKIIYTLPLHQLWIHPLLYKKMKKKNIKSYKK